MDLTVEQKQESATVRMKHRDIYRNKEDEWKYIDIHS